MIKESITVDGVIELLNQMLRLSPETIKHLINIRVQCDAALAEHPTIQVRRFNTHKGIGYEVGILGVLNGLFRVDNNGRGPITLETNSDGSIMQLKRTYIDQ